MNLPVQILRPFLGARIVKTGLAVFLSLAAFHWIGSEYGTFAAVAAIMGVQPSMVRARNVFTHQLIGNLIGGAVAVALGLWLGPTALAMALGVVLVLGICTRFRLTDAAGLAVFAVLFIMDRPRHDFLLYTLARVATIASGMAIGYLVNRFIRPPDFTDQLVGELEAAQDGIERFNARLLACLPTPNSLRKEQIKGEASAIRQRLDAAHNFLELSRESVPDNPRHLPLERTKASLSVFVERITDIHMLVLQAGGLQAGVEIDTVAAAMRATLQYHRTVVQALLHHGEPGRAAARNCDKEVANLERLVEQLVARQEGRQRGLLLHSILINIQHMHWRIDALLRFVAQ